MKVDFAIIFAAAALALLRCFSRRCFLDRMQTARRYLHGRACPYRKFKPSGAPRRNRLMFSSMVELLQLIWSVLVGLLRSRASQEAEIVALRHQLNVSASSSV